LDASNKSPYARLAAKTYKGFAVRKASAAAALNGGGTMQSALKWARWAAISAAVVGLFVAGGAAVFRKPLLIVWHWRGYEDALKGCNENMKRIEERVSNGVPRSALELGRDLEEPSSWLKLSQRLIGFPGAGYFTRNADSRASFHWAECRRLGYVETRLFPAREWALSDELLTGPDYPPTMTKANRIERRLRSPELALLEEDGSLVSYKGSPIRPRPIFLRVQDVRSRMPHWEAFIARHDAEDAAEEQQEKQIEASKQSD
jgi:hypothetical protein